MNTNVATIDTAMAILESNHMTAGIQTESGSESVVVARPGSVVVVKNGEAYKGDHLIVHRTYRYVTLLRRGRVIYRSTPLTRIDIWTN